MSKIPCDGRCDIFSNFKKRKWARVMCMAYEFSITKYQNYIFFGARIYNNLFQ